MGKIIRLSRTTNDNSILLAHGKKLYLRAIGDVIWNLEHEFEDDIKSIDYTTQTDKYNFATIFVLQENGKLFFSISSRAGFKELKLTEEKVNSISCSKFTNEYIVTPFLYLQIKNKIIIYTIEFDVRTIVNKELLKENNLRYEDFFKFSDEIICNDLLCMVGSIQGLHFIDKTKDSNYALYNKFLEDSKVELVSNKMKEDYKFILNNNIHGIFSRRGTLLFEKEEKEVAIFERIKNVPFKVEDIDDILFLYGQPKDEKYVYRVEFVKLKNGEIYIGDIFKQVEFKKVWFNGDDINDIDENVQFDEITDMINLIAKKTYEQKSEENTDSNNVTSSKNDSQEVN